jgi:hypothetical protein
MKKLIAYLNSKEFQDCIRPSDNYKYGQGEDIADTIGLFVVMGLVMLVIFI